MRIVPLLALACIALAPARAGETLLNGIALPDAWPPQADPAALKAGRYPTPPYLEHPPAVIPIEIGRQLFVDDYLVESTTMQRTSHAAKYHPANPLMTPDQPWEQKGEPTAMPFSDGVWHDPEDGLFKAWYMGGSLASTCLATSRDGLHWEKPAFDVVPGTNIVQPDTRDSNTVWLHLDERERREHPERRYKMWRSHRLRDVWGLTLHFSADGIHWSAPVLDTGSCGDRSTVFYNPFSAKWVYSLRHGWGEPRMRRYWEVKDVIAGPYWKAISEPPLWTGVDSLDHQRDDLKVPPQLYNLDCVGYESLIVGLFSIWRGQPADRPKPNEICVGFSRDGYHWTRPSHEAFIPVSEKKGDWNWGNVQSAGGCCLIVGDELWFYVSGRAGTPGSKKSGVSSMGLATLRRDGFVSMDAGAQEATLTTRPVKFSQPLLFVNADVRGELRVEVLDENSKPIPGFTFDDCLPILSNGTKIQVQWRGHARLTPHVGKPVRFRFKMRDASLYAFWLSASAAGSSNGATAAGGTGIRGIFDVPN